MVLAVFLLAIYAVNSQVVGAHLPKYSQSFLERQVPEDIVEDLAGRKKLVTRDDDTDELFVYWVQTDTKTGLPYVADTHTGLPYLLQYRVTSSDMSLYRLLRAQDHGPVVADLEKMTLFRPHLNQYKEVDLKSISELEAGFTAKEVFEV